MENVVDHGFTGRLSPYRVIGTLRTPCVVSRLASHRTALLFLDGLEVVDQGQDAANRVGFIDRSPPFWLAKHLASNRHVTSPMPLHLLAAVDDPVHLPDPHPIAGTGQGPYDRSFLVQPIPYCRRVRHPGVSRRCGGVRR